MNELSHIGILLGRAYHSYVTLLSRMLEEAELDEYFRPGMGNVLFALYEQDDVSATNIANRTKLSKSTMTRMLKRFKAAKLISIRKNPNDGRGTLIKLTPLANSLKPRVKMLAANLESILTVDLTKSEIEMFRNCLSKTNETMLNEMSESLSTSA